MVGSTARGVLGKAAAGVKVGLEQREPGASGAGVGMNAGVSQLAATRATLPIQCWPMGGLPHNRGRGLVVLAHGPTLDATGSCQLLAVGRPVT